MATTSIIVNFGGPNTTNTGWFTMATDRRDDADKWSWFCRIAGPFDEGYEVDWMKVGVFTRRRIPLRPGLAPVRFYHPDSITPEIIPLDDIPFAYPTTAEESQIGNIFINSNGYDNINQVVFKGRKPEQRIEVVQFDKNAEQTVPYAYDDPEITIRYTSIFLDENLNEVDAPTYAGDGKFVSPVPVYGALEVEYWTSYSYYWIYYDVPEIDEYVEHMTVVNGIRPQIDHIEGLDENRGVPDLQVVARAGQLITSLNIRREVQTLLRSFSTFQEDEEVEAELQEQSRVTVKDRVEDPDDPNTFVEVNRFKSIDMYDPVAKRFYKLKFNDPPEE